MNIATFITHSLVPPWHFQTRHADLLRQLIPSADVTVCHHQDEFAQALRDADVALAWVFRQEWFDAAPRLRVLSTPAAGKDYFHVTPPPTVTMLNGHFHGEIIAETVVGMLLGMTRAILPAATTYAGLPWPRAELTPLMRTLRGASVTILGFGHIGRWIGRLLKPFGTTLRGLVRHPETAPVPDWFDGDDALFGPDRLDAVLPLTQHLILALPSTTGTDRLLDARRLALLPQDATVINVGRGNAIDEDALLDALRARRLLGAALDVFAHEPLPAADPIRSCPRLWTLPHASAIADNYLELYVRELAVDLERLGVR